VACADTVVTLIDVPDTIYLARRVAYPMEGLWGLGGRINFNSANIQSAAADNVTRETGCEFPPERFEFVTVDHYLWSKYAQGDFPSKVLATLFRLDVSEDELVLLSKGLTASEYEPDFGLQPFTREQLIQANVHQAMLGAFDLIWT
jgi:hypothetical protein